MFFSMFGVIVFYIKVGFEKMDVYYEILIFEILFFRKVF